MHIHTKFGIPISKNIKDMFRTQSFLKIRSEVKVTVTQKWFVTLRHPNLKEYRGYAPDEMQFLETRSEVKLKVTVTQLWYSTLRHRRMHPHIKF